MSKNFNDDITTTPLISLIYRRHAIFLNEKVKEFDLTFGLYPFLMELYKHDGLSQEELAKAFYLNESTVTRNLKKLEEKNLIIKTQDKRKKIINLTDAGKEIVSKMFNYENEWDDKIKYGLSNEEFKQYKKILIKIGDRLLEE